jgi:hypothetical protein
VVVGYLLDYTGLLSFIITVPIGLLNIFLGGITPKSPGVTLPSEPSSPVRLLVDKGVVGSNTYELVFLGGKLILKRLSSASLTIVTPLILTIGGFLIIGNLIGAIHLWNDRHFSPRILDSETKRQDQGTRTIDHHRGPRHGSTIRSTGKGRGLKKQTLLVLGGSDDKSQYFKALFEEDQSCLREHPLFKISRRRG